MTERRALTRSAAAVLVLTFAAPAAPAQDPKPAAPAFREMSPEVQAAIERGLGYLARSQNPSGSWGNGSAPVATTAIAGMAFVAGGHLPGRSKYGENVKKAVNFLLKCSGRSGYINEAGAQRGAGGSGMHGHGYAAMFLAEVYGMTGDIADIDHETLKEKLSKAIQVIESSQVQNGGWNYDPSPSYDEGSVTVTQVQALRAARNAGIKVKMQTIEKAVDYINKSTDANGQTRYSLTSGGHTSFALSAAGMSVLNFLGAYDNPKIKKGLDSIVRSVPGGGANNANMGAWGGWYFYANYYATLATYQAGGPYWQKWWPSISKDLLSTQDKSSGAWRNGESGQYGDAFGTGFALQILTIPARLSPIYQRGSD
jgi:hypothetical protein